MNILKQIVEWNRERGLLKAGFNHEKEASFIIEELIESDGIHDSISARDQAEKISKEIITSPEKDEEKIIDALADIIVFATGGIAKLQYDPEKVMAEVIKEINSRTGKLVDGKFIKDPHAERYYADFSNCKFD